MTLWLHLGQVLDLSTLKLKTHGIKDWPYLDVHMPYMDTYIYICITHNWDVAVSIVSHLATLTP